MSHERIQSESGSNADRFQTSRRARGAGSREQGKEQGSSLLTVNACPQDRNARGSNGRAS